MSGSKLARRYQAIGYVSFCEAMARGGLQEVRLPGVPDYVFERPVEGIGLMPNRFRVRVFSSVHKTVGVTREVATDAIRVILLDTHLNIKVREQRVYRINGALTRTVRRTEEIIALMRSRQHICPVCGAVMLPKRGYANESLVCTAELFCVPPAAQRRLA